MLYKNPINSFPDIHVKANNRRALPSFIFSCSKQALFFRSKVLRKSFIVMQCYNNNTLNKLTVIKLGLNYIICQQMHEYTFNLG